MDHILVAEDEPLNMAVITKLLRRAGYTVHQAEDGKKALQMLEAAPTDFSVVVADRNMPLMGGMDLFQRMQKHPKLASIPLIMQTGAAEPEEVAEGIKAGVYYYLTKPFREESLITLISAAIRERRISDTFRAQISKHREALHTLVRSEFRLRTLEEVQNVALLLGGLFPQPELSTAGLYEILLNAVEHGNLGLGFKEKASLLEQGQWETRIKELLAKPENQEKFVHVQFVRTAKQIDIQITDQGTGFDWRPYLEIEPSRATQANGRGIAKANMLSFDRLTFLGKGNQVHIGASLEQAARRAPAA